ncbi:unnamed protein product [Camellia sinensis]
MECATQSVKKAVGSDLILHSAESEIGDSELPILIEEEILGLQISVKDAARVTVSDGGDQLLEVFTAEIFAEPSFGDLGEKLSSFGELHHEVDLRLRRQNFKETNDVRVAQPAHDSDLPLNVRRQASFQVGVLSSKDVQQPDVVICKTDDETSS